MKKILFIPLVIIIAFVIPTIVAFVLPSNPTNYYNAYNAKLQRWKSIDQPRLMLVGFSELAFGIDSKMIEDSTCYNVCNFGLHMGLGIDFITKDMEHLSQKGDVVVFCFPIIMTSDGTADAHSILYILDACPEKIMLFSLGNIKKTILGIYPFLKGKLQYNYLKMSDGLAIDTEYNSKNFNKYGDECSHWTKTKSQDDPIHFRSGPIENFNESLYEMIINTIKVLQEKGVTVIVIPQLLDEYNYADNKQMAMYLKTRLQGDGIRYAIEPEDFILKEEYSYVGSHANRQGVIWCTNQIIDALKSAGL